MNLNKLQVSRLHVKLPPFIIICFCFPTKCSGDTEPKIRSTPDFNFGTKCADTGWRRTARSIKDTLLQAGLSRTQRPPSDRPRPPAGRAGRVRAAERGKHPEERRLRRSETTGWGRGGAAAGGTSGSNVRAKVWLFAERRRGHGKQRPKDRFPCRNFPSTSW